MSIFELNFYNCYMISNLPSRTQLIAWVNQQTKSNISKLQDLSNAYQFCQIFDKIYPNIINLAKLKNNNGSIFQKEHNFRILLNALNSLGISVKMNIIDLSSGKITAILELLQWFYKEFRNPSVKTIKNTRPVQRISQPVIFKSYMGGIMQRQKSCIKVEDQNKKAMPLAKSLDLKRTSNAEQSKLKQNDGSEKQNKHSPVFQHPFQRQLKKQNPIHQTELKVQVQTLQKKNSFKRSIIGQQIKKSIPKITPQILQKRRIQKEQEIKRERQKRAVEKPKTQDYDQVEQVLKNALKFNKKGVHRSLVQVTTLIMQESPKLVQKVKDILKNQSDIQDNYSPKKQNTNKKILISNNSSLICQKDSPIQYFQKEQISEKKQVKIDRPLASFPKKESNQTNFMQEKKQTVTKDLNKKVENKSQHKNDSQNISYPDLSDRQNHKNIFNMPQKSKSKTLQEQNSFNQVSSLFKNLNKPTQIEPQKLENKKNEGSGWEFKLMMTDKDLELQRNNSYKNKPQSSVPEQLKQKQPDGRRLAQSQHFTMKDKEADNKIWVFGNYTQDPNH